MPKDSPRLLWRILVSAAPPLPGSRGLGLKVDAGGAAAGVGATPTPMDATMAAIAAAKAGLRREPGFITYFFLKLKQQTPSISSGTVSVSADALSSAPS